MVLMYLCDEHQNPSQHSAEDEFKHPVFFDFQFKIQFLLRPGEGGSNKKVTNDGYFHL